MAIEAFGRALRMIPTSICDNAGLDSAELLTSLRAGHATPGSYAGIDILTGKMGDMMTCGIFESFKVKQQIVLSATEASEMIIRVDDIIKCAPRQRSE